MIFCAQNVIRRLPGHHAWCVQIAASAPRHDLPGNGGWRPQTRGTRGKTLYYSLIFVPHEDGWLCEYMVQVELMGWLPKGPIEAGTVDATREFLDYVAGYDFAQLEEK